MSAPTSRAAAAIELLTILSDQSGTNAHTAVLALRWKVGAAWGEVLREATRLLETWYLNDSKAPAGPNIADLRGLGDRLLHQRVLSENDLMLRLIELARRYRELDGQPITSRINKARSRIEQMSQSHVPRSKRAQRTKAPNTGRATQQRCAHCGATISVSNRSDKRLPRHRAKGVRQWCIASGMTVDAAAAAASRSQQGEKHDVPELNEPSTKDLHWYEHESGSIPVTRRTEYHVRVARRLLRAGRANSSQYGYLVEPMERFLAATKRVRPQLFERPKGVRDAVAPGTLPDHLKGDPGKTLNNPRTAPSKRVWYREIPVGKTN